ncbi:DUF1565 domain-containing protein [Cerasicoccus arenae]|uniref:DUF1565 domain-containing protein n=2 Tax=Cerasicoccus arenae TaxID=424488 RepID=A0A8J3D8W3_9BACT|nr:DUF1565 domain-containing protein [Cerasicoccus arenae]MBK1857730.1 DUF1565 domain-containing protein [Cerasicoccus arenae]GHB91135.1 hypothetical protein GCM10007047_02600 [Cerasicoccus arenae]
MLLWSGLLEAVTLFVDVKTGDDSSSGKLQETPLKTIQAAVNVAQPGDQILVSPGVYHENVLLMRGGTSDEPLEIIALDGGCYQTVLSGAVPSVRSGDLEWELVDQTRGLYRIPFEYRPVRVLADRVDLLPYEQLDDLIAFRRLADEYPGNSHGFAWDADTKSLYVRLRADGKYGVTDPNQAVMAVGPRTAGGRWGATPNRTDNFLIALNFSGEAHVVIDGFTFETPGMAGVFSNPDDLTVRNSWFFGCRYGVAGREDGDTARVVVENCFYTQFPAYTDIEEVIRAEYAKSTTSVNMRMPIHWQRKAGFLPVTGGLQAPYSYETGLIRRIGREWTVRANWIFEAFEAFSSGSVSNSNDSIIENNRIERICDNAFETEEHAKALTIRGNLVIDVFEPFTWQPLNGAPLPGPIYIYDNIFEQTAADIELWKLGYSRGGVFKIGIKHDRFWDSGKMADVPRDRTPAPGGFWVVNNTLISPYKRMFTSLNPAGRKFENFYFINNIIMTWEFAQSRLPSGPEGIVYYGNAVSFVQGDAQAESIVHGADFSMLTARRGSPAGIAEVFQGLASSEAGWHQDNNSHTNSFSKAIPDCVPLHEISGAMLKAVHYGPQARDSIYLGTQKYTKQK